MKTKGLIKLPELSFFDPKCNSKMDKIARKTQNATKYSGDCENGRRTKL